MKAKNYLLSIAISLVLLTAVFMVSGSVLAQEPLKVGLVTDTGGLNDKGFNQLAHKGAQRAVEDFGIELDVVQSEQLTDFLPNLRNFAQRDYDLVIGVGYVMEDAIRQVASEYPEVKFLGIETSIDDMDNVASAVFEHEKAAYLIGAMAGLFEQENAEGLNSENVLGVIPGMQIPPVDAYVAGFKAGVKQVNPEAEVLLNYIGNFTDQQAGKEMALTQMSQGADIIFQVGGATGVGVIRAVQSEEHYAIGVDSDQNYLAPETVLTSALKKVDKATYNVIQDTVINNFESGIITFNLENDGVGYVEPLDIVSDEIVEEVEKLKTEIIEGNIEVPTQVD